MMPKLEAALSKGTKRRSGYMICQFCLLYLQKVFQNSLHDSSPLSSNFSEPSCRQLLRNLGHIPSFILTNIIIRKLPRANPLGKQNIHLLKCASSGLRQAEVRPHKRRKRGRAPDEPRIPLQIPLRRIHEVRLQNAGNDRDDIIRVSC